MKILLLITLLSSCSVKYKDEESKKDVTAIEKNGVKVVKGTQIFDEEPKEFVKESNFWPAKYYRESVLKISNPLIHSTKDEVSEVCKGPTLKNLKTYSGMAKFKNLYLSGPISIKTKSGFMKKVFITKGMCRELLLFLTKDNKGEMNSFRLKINSMRVHYIYTEKSFVDSISFKSKYREVDFVVR